MTRESHRWSVKHQVLPSSCSVSRWPRRPCLQRSPELRSAFLPAQEPPAGAPNATLPGTPARTSEASLPSGKLGLTWVASPHPCSATSSPRSCLGSPGADVFPEPNPRAPASLQDSLSPLFQLRAKCRPRSPGKTGPPRRKGWRGSWGGRKRTDRKSVV